VFLRHPISAYNSEALLELRDDRHMTVEVRAPSPDLFFNVLRDSIEGLITHRWPGLSYELLVPCPTHDPNGTACPGAFKLRNLLRFRERGKTGIDCQDCIERHDIGQLLTGFAVPAAPLKPELERLEQQLTDVASGVGRLELYAADSADSVRRVLKAIGTEVTDCPRLFTLTPRKASSWRRLRMSESSYRLMLWCEHPGQWHPWPPSSYDLHQPKDWLIRVSPYVNLVFKTLQLVVPVAAAVAGVALTEDQLKHAEHELELMKTLVDKLPADLPEDPAFVFVGESEAPTSRLSAAEGSALRSLRLLLYKLDHARSFGDLRRVQAPSGEFLWVCATHHGEYDPGLPSIPGSDRF
jgi:hypothetical protein